MFTKMLILNELLNGSIFSKIKKNHITYRYLNEEY